MTTHDYRDNYSLADAIADVYTDGLTDGQGHDALDHDNRDYAMQRAARLEAELSDLKIAMGRSGVPF